MNVKFSIILWLCKKIFIICKRKCLIYEMLFVLIISTTVKLLTKVSKVSHNFLITQGHILYVPGKNLFPNRSAFVDEFLYKPGQF